jgi:propionyl-CoA carboxylase alpha chain
MLQLYTLPSISADTIFLEKFVVEPRHIEVQILADKHGNTVYLNERECSIQRRNQKVIEEAPSMFVTPELRKAMGEQAVALAAAVDYNSAGTVEFLVDKDSNFYFLEMNTRLQVEHPVTEYITGVDIVEHMIKVAAGQKLALKQSDVKINGWAFESRVYAEDPLRGFLPSIGRLSRYNEPTDATSGAATGEVRVDSGVTEGSEISVHYDPMISKLITHGATRDAALANMRRALDSYVISGVTDNINFLRTLTDHPRFIDGDINTNFIAEEFPDGYAGHQLSLTDRKTLVTAALAVWSRHLEMDTLFVDGSQLESFDTAAFIAKAQADAVVSIIGQTQTPPPANEDGSPVLIGDDVYSCAVVDDGTSDSQYQIAVAADAAAADNHAVSCDYSKGDIVFTVTVDGVDSTLQLLNGGSNGDVLRLQLRGTPFDVRVESSASASMRKLMPVKVPLDTSKMILSPMPGSIFSVSVSVGDVVAPGAEIAVVEAMKMQNALRTDSGGTVKAVNVVKGDTVVTDFCVVEFE